MTGINSVKHFHMIFLYLIEAEANNSCYEQALQIYPNISSICRNLSEPRQEKPYFT